MTTHFIEQWQARSSEKLGRLTDQLIILLTTSGLSEVDSFVAVVKQAHDAYQAHLGELEMSQLVRLNGLMGNLRLKLLGEMVKPVPITVILDREISKINIERSWMTLNALAFLSGFHPNLQFEEDTQAAAANLTTSSVSPGSLEVLNQYLEMIGAKPLSLPTAPAA